MANQRDLTEQVDNTKLLKETQLKSRVFNYVKAIIRRSAEGYCSVSQTKLAKCLKVRRASVTRCLEELVADGKLTREVLPNRNRPNPKHHYRMAGGTPNKSDYASLASDELKGEEVMGYRIDKLVGIGLWGDMDRLDLISAYIDSGLQVTPLIERGKLPPKGWSKDFLSLQSKEQLLKFFGENPNLNVGCWMPDNFLAIEVDDLPAFYAANGGEDYDTLTAESGRLAGGCHYYVWHEGLGSGNGIRQHADGTSILDFKTAGSLMVLPPSLHKSGKPYRWTNLAAPIDAPAEIVEMYRTRENLKTPPTCCAVADSATVTVAPKNFHKNRGQVFSLRPTAPVPQGSRYRALFRYGRQMRWTLSAEEVTRELQLANEQFCNPVLESKRMSALIRDVLYGKDRADFTK